MGLAAMLITRPGPFDQFFPRLLENTYEKLVTTGPAVSEEKSCESVDGRRRWNLLTKYTSPEPQAKVS